VASNGKSGLTAACTYPVEPGLKVITSSEKVSEARRLALELLLAQHPHSVKIQRLAQKLSVNPPPFTLEEKECILCQLCARTCREIVGASAISFISPGLGRENNEAQIEVSQVKCIACGSCCYVCPTQAISMEDSGDTRTICTPSGQMEFKLKRCNNCGRYWAPEKQLEYMAEKSGLELAAFDLCTDCRD
jgi:predicted molibdopterin-dependent oxidoreductase YjgC